MTSLAFPFDAGEALQRLDRRAHVFEDRASQDPCAHFRMILPDAWHEVRPSGQPTALGGTTEIRRFNHKSVASAEIQVSIIHLPFEVAPADWLTFVVEQNGERIVNRFDQREPIGETAHILSLAPDGVARRCYATKNGKTLIHSSGRCRETDYGDLADELFVAVGGLALLGDKPQLVAETTEQVPVRGDQVEVRVTRLESWTTAIRVARDAEVPRLEPTGETQFQLLRDDQVQGSITIELFEGEGADPNVLLAALVATHRRNGIELEGAEATPAGTDGRGEHRWVCELIGTAGGNRLDCSTVLFGQSDRMVRLSMMTPEKSGESLLWAIARRALDVACESLEIHPIESRTL